MFPNNFPSFGSVQKKWCKNLNYDEISQLFYGNCDKMLQEMLNN